MKKPILFFSLFALLLGCQKDDPAPNLIGNVQNVVIKNVLIIDKNTVNADPAFFTLTHQQGLLDDGVFIESGWYPYGDSLSINLNYQMGDKDDNSLIYATLSDCEVYDPNTCTRLGNYFSPAENLFDNFFKKEYCFENDFYRICFRYDYIFK